jgi:hypothetical protein
MLRKNAIQPSRQREWDGPAVPFPLGIRATDVPDVTVDRGVIAGGFCNTAHRPRGFLTGVRGMYLLAPR